MISEREEGEECSDSGTEKAKSEAPDDLLKSRLEDGTDTNIASFGLGQTGGSGLLDMFSQSLMNAGEIASSAEKLAALSKKSEEPKPKYKKLGEPPDPVPLPILPQRCYINMSKNVLIEKLLAKYYLTWHPLPKLFGELLVFKKVKAD